MHLKTILIFCSFSFFKDTMSEGLNIFHIDFFETLIMSKYGENITKINQALLCHEIRLTFNNYNLEDKKSVRIFKIFNFLVHVKKTGDEKTIEKLNENDVEIISNIFSNLDTDNDGLINNEKLITLIDSIGYCSSTGNVIINIYNYLRTSYTSCPAIFSLYSKIVEPILDIPTRDLK
ncbi:uncharacterized protein LOC126909244 [Daktulosphaira vitifoliae]|uniref:uncharacterized protein LOC126909244 n=1 Tax=Daktulosphaira vitifoliae TaxID=58002 RepID=UPI0021A995CD|nr:uncharacterized protein LOC126909244 [Daktulosphaira vitifoliae]